MHSVDTGARRGRDERDGGPGGESVHDADGGGGHGDGSGHGSADDMVRAWGAKTKRGRRGEDGTDDEGAICRDTEGSGAGHK